MKKTKVFAAIICVMLCISLAACTTVQINLPVGVADVFMRNFVGTGSQPTGGNQPTAPTSATVENTPTTSAPAGEVPSSTQAEIPSSAAPTDAPVTNPPVTNAPVTNPPAATNGAPTTKEEIVKYYETAYNKIATDAKKVTRTYDYTSNYNNILEINNNSTLEGIAGKLMKQFMVENKDAVEMSAKDLPPVGVTKLSISPDKISSATCTDKGSTYEIVLKSTGTDAKWEIDSQPGVGSAGCIGPLLRTEDVTGAAGSLIKFEGLHSWYGTASVKATVDKATGHITSFRFETPSVLHFDKVTAAVVISVPNCNIGLLFAQNWTVQY